MNNVVIETSKHFNTRIYIDGQELKWCTGIAVDVRPAQAPKVMFEVLASEVHFEGDSDVTFRPKATEPPQTPGEIANKDLRKAGYVGVIPSDAVVMDEENGFTAQWVDQCRTPHIWTLEFDGVYARLRHTLEDADRTPSGWMEVTKA